MVAAEWRKTPRTYSECCDHHYFTNDSIVDAERSQYQCPKTLRRWRGCHTHEKKTDRLQTIGVFQKATFGS
ncbi:hypothetical protein DPMN_110905 [Dreissena polymorpha]|uniref:Uncharacterized protein n=1 Tax=Dreissena polymorpha TaxID=45954 RepID=A0A9D4KDN8_DREPO|nr:hypothetical protein DPMN_110905 [Dreissena polymorpha]